MRDAFANLFLCGPLIITAAITTGNAKTRPEAAGALPIRSLTITVISGRPVVDGVYLNGQGPFLFLIDTGAQTNQLEAAIARSMSLKPAFRSEIATIAGRALVPGGRMAKVTLGTAAAVDQEFLFTSMDTVHQLLPGVQGIIGQEFLSRFDYLLDFSGRRILFGAEETEGGDRVDLSLVDGLPAVDTDKGKLVLDSGTDVAIFYAASAEQSGARLITASGSSPISRARDRNIRVAGRSYSPVTASVPRPLTQDLRGDGLLPASVFRAVYVSNSAKYLVLDPRHVQPSAIRTN